MYYKTIARRKKRIWATIIERWVLPTQHAKLHFQGTCSKPAGQNYWQNWNNSNNKYLNDNIQYKTVLSDYFHNSTTNSDPLKFNPENEPSQDQHIALMMGFIFVKELVGSITVQPTPQDHGLDHRNQSSLHPILQNVAHWHHHAFAVASLAWAFPCICNCWGTCAVHILAKSMWARPSIM